MTTAFAREYPDRPFGERETASPGECPLCRAPAQRKLAKHGFEICRCTGCRHVFADAQPAADHVEAVYGDEYFSGGGAGYGNYLAEEPLLIARGRRYARIVARHARPGRVLDVGAAAGFVLRGMVDSGWKGAGLEPNDRMASHARSTLGLDVRTGSLETHPLGERYDLVSMIQVVAHFVDPHAAFESVAALTAPGGLCLVETWNVESWTARLCGSAWHEYSPPSVLHWYTPQSLQRLAAAHGFQQVDRGRLTKWLDGEHAKSLLRYKLAGSAVGRFLSRCLAIVPDRLPIPYPSEDLFWALFRRA